MWSGCLGFTQPLTHPHRLCGGHRRKNGRSFQINSEGNSLKITSLGQRGGSLTLYSTRSFSLDGKVENERDEHAQLASLLIEHDQHNSFDVIHAHKDIFLQYLSAASLSHKALLHAHDGKIENIVRKFLCWQSLMHKVSG